MKTSLIRRLSAALGAASVLLTGALVLGTAGSASAATTVVDSGTPGFAAAPFGMALGYADPSQGDNGRYYNSRTLKAGAVHVWPAPGTSGIEYVTVEAQFSKLDLKTGQWTPIGTPRYVGSMITSSGIIEVDGNSGSSTAWTYDIPAGTEATWYSVSYHITWRTTDFTVLGSSTLTSSTAKDNVCDPSTLFACLVDDSGLLL